jgi:hypothetical protein
MSTIDVTELDPDTRGWRRYLPPTPWFAAIAIVASVVLGVLGGLADRLPWWISWVGNLAALWLFAAFIAGAAGRGAWAGLARGVVALWATVAVYYLLQSGLADRPDTGRVLAVGSAWLVIAVPAGALFGYLGALWRRGRTDFTAGAVGVLSAALAGEGIYAIVAVWAWGIGMTLLLGIEILLAAWLPLVLLQSWRRRGIAYGIAVAGLVGAIVGPLVTGMWA